MGSPFSKLFTFNPFKKKPDSVIGIDVGTSAIKVVQLRRRHDVAVLETYGEIALGPYAGLKVGQATRLSTEKVIRALMDVMTEADVTSRVGGISIPFTSSLVTMVRMPPLPKKQLEKMIPIEARKYIPVSTSEVSLDWFIIPEENKDDQDNQIDKSTSQSDKRNSRKESPGVNVLLVAIHNDVLATYRSIVEGAELSPTFFEIEIFSNIRAVVGQTLSPVGVLDIGATKTKFYIVEYGIVKMSHLINQGAQDVTLSLSRSLGLDVGHAEEYKRREGLVGEDPAAREAMNVPLDRIFSEINRVLVSYERKHNRNISKVVSTGGGSVLKGFLPLAKEKLETEVVLGDPFAKVETPAFLGEVLRQVGPEFSVAVGLALRNLQESS